MIVTSEGTSALNRFLAYFPPYQLRWIWEPARFATCVKARQIGFSFATAAAAVIRARYEKRTQLILSASQDLSTEVLTKCRAHCGSLADLGDTGADKFSVDSFSEIAWHSGGRVVALPANPRTARSYSGDVWLDEAAYFQDIEGIRDAVLPMVSRGDNQFRAVSTPNGAQGWFYDLVARPLDGWATHRVSVDDAIRDGFNVDLGKLWQACGGDERLFAQWFQCSFIDSDLQYFPTALVDAALKWEKRPSLNGCERYAGLDIGRTNDLTSLVTVAVRDEVAWVEDIQTCRRTTFAEQKRMIDRARDRYDWSTLHIDETGLGRGLAEELVEDYGEDEAVPISFTNLAKADLATRTLRWLRDGRLKFPKDAEGKALRDDTIAIRRTVTPSGNVAFDAPHTERGHSDRLWALALALKGAGEPQTPVTMGRTPLLAV